MARNEAPEGGFKPIPDPETSPRHPQFDVFVQTIAELRSPGGCPWDLKQTHASIAQNLLEEAFEAVAAIEEGDADHMCEELGDVLLEVVLQSQIAADEGEFTIDDVVRGINEKIWRRHPHVFGAQAALRAAGMDPDAFVESADDVDALWDVIKGYEKRMKDEARAAKREAAGLDPCAPRSLLDDVSAAQPALMEAQEISRKAVSKGFEWESVSDVWDKVREEIDEFSAAPPRSEQAEVEFGDILFSLVNVARREHLDAETCLRKSNAKFRRRWEAMESHAFERGCDIGDLEFAELDALWDRVKREEGAGV